MGKKVFGRKRDVQKAKKVLYFTFWKDVGEIYKRHRLTVHRLTTKIHPLLRCVRKSNATLKISLLHLYSTVDELGTTKVI